jgi:hemolysin D
MIHLGNPQLEDADQVVRLKMSALDHPGRSAQLLLYLIGVTLCCFSVWAGFIESDVCAEAKGRFEPRTRPQVIKPAVDGTVAKFLVTDEAFVRKGTPLILLNVVRIQAELDKQKHQLAILEADLQAHEKSRNELSKAIAHPDQLSRTALALPELDRIAGEVYQTKKNLERAAYDTTENVGVSISQTPEMVALIAQRTKLEAGRKSRTIALASRSNERSAELAKLTARIQGLEAELSKARIVLQEMEASLADAQKELQIYEDGLKLGIASEVKYLQAQSFVHQKRYNVIQQKAQIAGLEQQLRSATIELQSSKLAFEADKADMQANLKADEARIGSIPLAMNSADRNLHNKQAEFEVASYRARARFSKEYSEVHELQRKIGECAATIDLLNQQVAQRTIEAPVDGTVTRLVHLAVGEMVMRGQALLTIVPSDAQLVVKAHVRSTDIGLVEKGQTVRLRLPAFPCEEFGVLKGTVEEIGAFPEPTEEQNARLSTYRVVIVPSETHVRAGSRQAACKPGLQADCDIVVRKRTLLALLFEPFLKYREFQTAKSN